MTKILGIGNDIIEIERIRSGISEHGERFLERIFTEKEREYCLKYKDAVPHFAGRFAAKEAIVKALGCGLGTEAHWQDISILADSKGKPEVSLSNSLSKRFQSPHLLISISHCKLYATAFAICFSMTIFSRISRLIFLKKKRIAIGQSLSKQCLDNDLLVED